jgi:hypothetical protein
VPFRQSSSRPLRTSVRPATDRRRQADSHIELRFQARLPLPRTLTKSSAPCRPARARGGPPRDPGQRPGLLRWVHRRRMPGRRPPPDPTDHAPRGRSRPRPYSRGQRHLSSGKYHNKREFVALARKLGLAWPDGQRPHPVIGFSEVTLTGQTLDDYTDTLAYLGAAIRLSATSSAASA